MAVDETVGAVHDLLLVFLPLPQLAEQELHADHWLQLTSLGHWLELQTEDSTFRPSHLSLLTKHIRLLE